MADHPVGRRDRSNVGSSVDWQTCGFAAWVQQASRWQRKPLADVPATAGPSPPQTLFATAPPAQRSLAASNNLFYGKSRTRSTSCWPMLTSVLLRSYSTANGLEINRGAVQEKDIKVCYLLVMAADAPMMVSFSLFCLRAALDKSLLARPGHKETPRLQRTSGDVHPHK